jgi:subtilisin family serine protease
MYLDQYTGRGVRVAIIDSGVNPDHPHVAGVFGAIAIRPDGSSDDDYIDRLGHGTAVAAAIREKAPGAELLAVKVFYDRLATNVGMLLRAIDTASDSGASVINLSLGTAETSHRDALRSAVQRARDRGAFIVSALESNGVRWLPGSLADVVAVTIDWECDRHSYRVIDVDGVEAIAASGYPRGIPGVPRERNLKGISFAVANAAGFVARALEATAARTIKELFEALRSETQCGVTNAAM